LIVLEKWGVGAARGANMDRLGPGATQDAHPTFSHASCHIFHQAAQCNLIRRARRFHLARYSSKRQPTRDKFFCRRVAPSDTQISVAHHQREIEPVQRTLKRASPAIGLATLEPEL